MQFFLTKPLSYHIINVQKIPLEYINCILGNGVVSDAISDITDFLATVKDLGFCRGCAPLYK